MLHTIKKPVHKQEPLLGPLSRPAATALHNPTCSPVPRHPWSSPAEAHVQTGSNTARQKHMSTGSDGKHGKRKVHHWLLHWPPVESCQCCKAVIEQAETPSTSGRCQQQQQHCSIRIEPTPIGTLCSQQAKQHAWQLHTLAMLRIAHSSRSPDTDR